MIHSSSYIVFICYCTKCFHIDLKEIYISHNDFTSKRRVYFQCQHVEWYYDQLLANDANLNNKTTTTKHEILTNDDEHTHWNNHNHIDIHFFRFIAQEIKDTVVQDWIIWWKRLDFIFSVWIQNPNQAIHWQKNNWWWKKSIVIHFQFFKWWNNWLYSFLNKNCFKFIIHERIYKRFFNKQKRLFWIQHNKTKSCFDSIC